MTNSKLNSDHLIFKDGQRPLFIRSCIVLLIITLSLSLSLPSFAQLKLSSIPKPVSTIPLKKNARTESIPTLPFWDDFSFYSLDANGLPIANTDLWESDGSVWINNGMGINMPTVYVATFDGLNAQNIPYNPIEILEIGFSDTLTSKPIDLSSVPPAQVDSVWLSFFYQWQGNGEAPDKNDYLLVEFFGSDDKWLDAEILLPEETPDRTKFIFKAMQITSEFHHDGFRFRIQRYGRSSGPYDTWNIDYVYLNTNRHENDISFPDRAAASGISPLFGRYRSVPLKHFFDEKELVSASFDVQNLKDGGLPSLSYRATADFTNYYSTTTPATTTVELVPSAPVNDGGGLTDPFERVHVLLDNLPDADDPLQFDPLADSIVIRLKMDVISNDEDDGKKYKFSPLDLRVNDSISTTFTLKDYYAYDDGVAEYAAGLTQPGNMAAVEFNMPEETKDTLVAILFYFPDYAISNNTSVDFTIYSNLSGDNETVLQTINSKSIVPKGLNNFTQINFQPPLPVEDKFYIGWTQPSVVKPQVGLDYSNDTGDKIFVKTFGTWKQNTSIHGSLMIRPVFGRGNGGVVTNLPEEKSPLRIYPNPNDGSFFINGMYDHLQIINTTGQSINFSSEDFGGKTKITLAATAGLYLVKTRVGASTVVKKIVVK
jgi:hypothetical protein